MLLALINAICVLVFPPKSGITVWLCSLWELSHPSCFVSQFPRPFFPDTWFFFLLSLFFKSLHPCSLDILHCQLSSPWLLLSCLQAVLTRSRHTDGFALNKSYSPFLFFFFLWHRVMPKWGISVVSSTFFPAASSQFLGLLKKTVSRWLLEYLQRRRIWLRLSFEDNFQQGVMTRRHLQFLPPRVWSCCCRETFIVGIYLATMWHC